MPTPSLTFKRANFLLESNTKTCFQSLFHLLILALKSMHHLYIMQTRKLNELQNILQTSCSPSSNVRSLTSKCFWEFVFKIRDSGNTTKQCYLTTVLHYNKSNMFEKAQMNYIPFSVQEEIRGKANIFCKKLSKLDYVKSTGHI